MFPKGKSISSYRLYRRSVWRRRHWRWLTLCIILHYYDSSNFFLVFIHTYFAYCAYHIVNCVCFPDSSSSDTKANAWKTAEIASEIIALMRIEEKRKMELFWKSSVFSFFSSNTSRSCEKTYKIFRRHAVKYFNIPLFLELLFYERITKLLFFTRRAETALHRSRMRKTFLAN